MNQRQRFLIFILLFSVLGGLLSGYLAYWNYFGPGCSEGPLSWLVTCGGPKAVKIFGQPTCVYGFTMFTVVAVLAVYALLKKSSRMSFVPFIVLGICGTLFAGFLSIYEIFYLHIELNALPACVYGLIFYLGILFTAGIGQWSSQRVTDPLDTFPS